MALKWAKWLRHPCRLGDPHRFRVGGKIRNGPQVGKVATSPLPSRGSPPLQSGRKIRSGPQVGKVATSPLQSRGSPPLQSGGGKSELAHLWAKWLYHPCLLGDPNRFKEGGKSEVALKWAKRIHHPCRLGDPHRCRAGGGGIRSGPQVGKVATSPLPSRGSPPLQSGEGESEAAHLWAKWLPHPCRLGDPHCFRAGKTIRSGPLVGKVATSPLPSRGSPPLQSGGEIRSGPQVGKVATSLLPSRGSRPLQSGGEIRSGPPMGKLAMSPLPSRVSPPLQSGGEIRSGPQVGKVATSPLPSRGSPMLQSGGQNQKWPTSGQSGYVTPVVSGIPTASERGAKSKVAHLWAKWLPHPCRLRDPDRFSAGGKIRSGPLVGKVATSPLPSRGSPPLRSGGAKSEVAHKRARCTTSPLRSRGSPPLRSGGQDQKWPTSGQGGYITPAVSGITTAAELR